MESRVLRILKFIELAVHTRARCECHEYVRLQGPKYTNAENVDNDNESLLICFPSNIK